LKIEGNEVKKSIALTNVSLDNIQTFYNKNFIFILFNTKNEKGAFNSVDLSGTRVMQYDMNLNFICQINLKNTYRFVFLLNDKIFFNYSSSSLFNNLKEYDCLENKFYSYESFWLFNYRDIKKIFSNNEKIFLLKNDFNIEIISSNEFNLNNEKNIFKKKLIPMINFNGKLWMEN
jgi:hypothetical protein